MILKSQTRFPQLKVPPRGLVLTIFTFWKKIHRLQPDLNPRTLDLEARSLLPNALRPFNTYYAPPNLGITRTWICRLNFAQRPIFSCFRFFNEPEMSDLKSLPEDLCSGFLRSEKKSIDLSRVWTREPWISRRARYPETTYKYIFFVARKLDKPTGKSPPGRPKRRWEDSIRMDLEEIDINMRNWVDSPLDRDYWRALVNAILNPLVHKHAVSYLPRKLTIY